jgi:type I restriction enzyme S subunit
MDIGLPLPSKSEQEKIAEFLMAVDERIRLQEQKLVKLEQYKRGVMQQIFSQKIRFKDENGNTYPDWEEKKLGEIARVYQPLTISQSDLTKTGYPVYGANGIIGKYDRFNHENEQIAVTCRGNTCGVINYTQPKSWITGNAMVINTDDSSKADKKFMYYQLLSQNLNYLITGSGQPQITGDIKQHKIFVPFIKEQQKIANFLTALDDKITAEKSKLTAAKQFKKALLQRMFV